jgi:Flp pilus assembly protein protease CpaA
MSLTVVAIVVGKFLVFPGPVSAAASDVSRRIIPNWLALTVAGGGVVFRLATASRPGMWLSAGAAVIVFVGLQLLSGLGILGAGDVKLIATVTLGQPPVSMLPILLGIGVAGGAVALFYLVRDRIGRRGKCPTAGPSRRGSWDTNFGTW